MTEQPLTARLAEGIRTAPTAANDGWNAHPTFPGVRLKPLATGAETAGAFSTLMVRLAPGAAMLPHVHDGQTEQHLVLEGSGRMTLAQRSIDYAPGSLAVIPRETEHSVTAGDDGMVLMALFAPAIN